MFPYDRFKDMIGFLYVAASILIGVSATLLSNANIKDNVVIMFVNAPFAISLITLVTSTGIFMDMALAERKKDMWYSRNNKTLIVWLVQLSLVSSLVTILLLLLSKVWTN